MTLLLVQKHKTNSLDVSYMLLHTFSEVTVEQIQIYYIYT